MRIRVFRPAVLALLTVLLVAGSAPILASADDPGARASEGYSDLVAFGTAWVAERRPQLELFRPYGWGTEVKVKAAYAPGYQYVHIPIPYMSVEEGTGVKLDKVEFCAASTNGGVTHPTQVALWRDTNTGAALVVPVQNVTWANNNNKQCISVDVNPDTWVQSLGVSVQLFFGSAADKITLYKAWARVQP